MQGSWERFIVWGNPSDIVNIEKLTNELNVYKIIPFSASKKIGLDSPVSTFNKNKITGRLNPINGIPKSLNSGIKVEALNWAISVSESSKLSIE